MKISDKSFLRRKWEDLYIELIKKRIPRNISSSEMLVLDNYDIELNSFFDEDIPKIKKCKYLIITFPINNIKDINSFFFNLNQYSNDDCKIIIYYFSSVWKLIFNICSYFGIIKNFKQSTFFNRTTFKTLLKLSNFEISSNRLYSALPLNIKFISILFNIIVRLFTILNNLSFSQIVFLRKKAKKNKKIGKFSIIIPCKDEEENISMIFNEISKNIKFDFEIVFVNDQSADSTKKTIEMYIQKFPNMNVVLVEGPGEGKSRAVDVGIKNAKGEYCIILDADLTVKVIDLNLFYKAIENNLADVINGSRLILRMEEGSMPYSNYIGNIFFSKLISWIASVNISDSLCGTKCFKTEDWAKFEEYREQNNIKDLWGDFSILFGSSYYGFKLIDIPIKYFRREHGQTKMNRRVYYFFNMLGICLKNLINFKFSK